MKQEQLNRILRLVNKTGDKFIVADQETDGVFVVMDMLDYEEIQGIYNESDEWDFNDDEDEIDDFDIDNIPEFREKDEDIDETDEYLEKEAEISQNNDFSDDFLSNDEEKQKNNEINEDLDEKNDYIQPEKEVGFSADIVKPQNTDPSFTPLGQLLRNKDFLKDEPVIEEINPLSELNDIYEEVNTEESNEDLSEEDKDRFYLEPV